MVQKNDPQLASLIAKRLEKFHQEEAVWIDMHVRAQWPRWFTSLAEKGNGLPSRVLRLFISRFAGLEIKRQQHNEIRSGTPKGFRAGYGSGIICKDVTSTIFKHRRGCKMVKTAEGSETRPNCGPRCVVATRTFEVGVPL